MKPARKTQTRSYKLHSLWTQACGNTTLTTRGGGISAYSDDLSLPRSLHADYATPQISSSPASRQLHIYQGDCMYASSMWIKHVNVQLQLIRFFIYHVFFFFSHPITNVPWGNLTILYFSLFFSFFPSCRIFSCLPPLSHNPLFVINSLSLSF